MAQRQLAAVAVDVIRQHPRGFVLAHLGGFARSWVPQEHRFWYGRLTGRAWEDLGTPEGVLGQALALGKRAGWGAAVRFVWQARVVGLPPLAQALWLGWLVAYVVSGGLLAWGTWRCRLPVTPLLIALMAAALPVAWRHFPAPIQGLKFRVQIMPL